MTSSDGTASAGDVGGAASVAADEGAAGAAALDGGAADKAAPAAAGVDEVAPAAATPDEPAPCDGQQDCADKKKPEDLNHGCWGLDHLHQTTARP